MTSNPASSPPGEGCRQAVDTDPVFMSSMGLGFPTSFFLALQFSQQRELPQCNQCDLLPAFRLGQRTYTFSTAYLHTPQHARRCGE
jgi:hypothetical protein